MENPCDGFVDDRSNMLAARKKKESWVEKTQETITVNEGRWRAMRQKLDRRHGHGKHQALPRGEIDEIWRQVGPR